MSAVITGQGVYDIPEDVYHSDPVPGGSLSASGAKKLLLPYCPAIFEHERKQPPEPTNAMELGSAAHKLVLGAGQEIAELPYKNYRKNEAQDAAEAARTAGKLPLLTHEHETVKAMAARLRTHRMASALLNPARGLPEQSLFWQADGIWKRARLDQMPDPRRWRLPVITDYKTCQRADRKSVAKAIADYSYHLSAAWYLEGFRLLTGCAAEFVLIFQQRTAPYLVFTCHLHPDALNRGRELAAEAVERYRDCTEAGVWPGYQEDGDLDTIDLPYWAYREDY